MTHSQLVKDFIKKWGLFILGLTKSLADKVSLDVVATQSLYAEKLIKDMFALGEGANIALIRKQIVSLGNKFDLPLKYNKNLLKKITGTSLFQGYGEKEWVDKYSKKQADKLKRVILTAKYNNTDEKTLTSQIMALGSSNKKQAQLIARNEIQRLREGVNATYYVEAGLGAEYDRVWVTSHDERVRESHVAMDGKKADPETGLFDTPHGKVAGPGAGGSVSFSINCRCKTIFVKRKKD